MHGLDEVNNAIKRCLELVRDRVDHRVPVMVNVLKHSQSLKLAQVSAHKGKDTRPEQEQFL